jgi:hypothetical protein
VETESRTPVKTETRTIRVPIAVKGKAAAWLQHSKLGTGGKRCVSVRRMCSQKTRESFGLIFLQLAECFRLRLQHFNTMAHSVQTLHIS